MLPSQKLVIRYFVAATGDAPFAKWFSSLEPITRAKITRALARMEQGNLSDVKSVGAGVFEYRLNFGPGYRLYFGRDGDIVVLLLTGGTKRRQQRDIGDAQAYLQAYEQVKRGRRTKDGDGT